VTTPTNKHVTRVTMSARPVKPTLSGRAAGKPRRLIVKIIGDTLYLRPQGLRKGLYADIWDVFNDAQRREIRSMWAQKQNAKRRGKRGPTT
jgi:hypothetical protein